MTGGHAMVARKSMVADLVMLAISLAGTAYLAKWLASQLDPHASSRRAGERKRKSLEERLGRPLPTFVGLEAAIADDVIDGQDMDVSLNDVGGLENIIKALNEKIILPLRRPLLFQSNLLTQTKGVLLFGPPGTGKTMLARALARESGATFINIRASSIQSKWFGDSHKLVSAIFTLAWKLQPSIIFIDEVDGVLGKRRGDDHEAITSIKTEFMQLWDGFLTERKQNVLVLGATNRPADLDAAVLRRFNLKFEVPLPDEKQRELILYKTLLKHATEGSEVDADLLTNPRAEPAPVDSSPDSPSSLDEPAANGPPADSNKLLANGPSPAGNGLPEGAGDKQVAAAADGLPNGSSKRPLQRIARQTPGLSGSDLFELCSQAAAIPVQEYIDAESTESRESGSIDASDSSERPRPLAVRDLDEALRLLKQNSGSADSYVSSDIPAADPSMLLQLLAYLTSNARQQPTPA